MGNHIETLGSPAPGNERAIDRTGGRVINRLRGTRRSREAIEIGSPQPFDDPGSTTLAGAAATSHNGTIIDIAGSWVEISIEGVNRQTFTAFHNLFLDTPEYAVNSTAGPNVRWQVMGWIHDSTASSPLLSLNVWYEGGTVAVNSLPMVANIGVYGGSITIDGDHPMKLSMFFTKADK